MSVLIHPAACSPAKIAAIQLQTGLRAVIGRKFGQLVLPNGKSPTMRTNKHQSVPFFTPPGGGEAA